MAAGFALVVGSVAATNYRYYGVFVTNEFVSGAFRAAYGALSRIRHETPRRFVVFPKDARDKAYAVSPAARELQPALDGQIGENWRTGGCALAHNEACPEILAGWFVFAFRDAVAAAGHYSSGRAAFAYYRRLAREINAACDDGRLSCLAARRTLAPPFQWQFVPDTVRSAGTAMWILLRVGGGHVNQRTGWATRARMDYFASVAGPVPRPRTPVVRVSGRIIGTQAPEILIRDREGRPFVLELDTDLPISVDITVKPIPTAFDLATDCARPTCELVVRSGREEWATPLPALKVGQVGGARAFTVAIDMAETTRGSFDRPYASPLRRAVHVATAGTIAVLYSIAVPLLTLLAVAGALAGIVRRISVPAGIWVMIAACVIAVASRIGLLAYIHATSLPALNLLYLSPASPFLLIFVVLGLYVGTLAWRDFRDARIPGRQ